MGETTFEFTFKGNKELFLNKMNTWLTTTTEGNRYSIKPPQHPSIFKIKRGLGFLTAPIIMEFYIKEEKENLTDMRATGYVKAVWLFKQTIQADAKAGAIPRRNGWKDMLKILGFLGVEQYHHYFGPAPMP